MRSSTIAVFFFLNDPATPEIYTLPLHDALPIYQFEGRPPRCQASRERSAPPKSAVASERLAWQRRPVTPSTRPVPRPVLTDRKSTRLNSSHLVISYAVFCLYKKTHNLASSSF